MAPNVAVFLISFSTFLVAVSSFRSFSENSFAEAITSFTGAGLAWSVGAIVGYMVPALRQSITLRSLQVRWIAVLLMGGLMSILPLYPAGPVQMAIFLTVMLLAGMQLTSLIGARAEEVGEMRDAYAKSLIGAALGAGSSSAMINWPGAIPLAAGVVILLPIVEPSLFFLDPQNKVSGKKRWLMAPLAVAMFAASFIFINNQADLNQTSSVSAGNDKPLFAAKVIFAFRTDRKFDVYTIGAGAANLGATLSSDAVASAMRTLTVTEQRPAIREFSPSGVEAVLNIGDGRRRLANETRRFDLIQVVASESSSDSAPLRFDARLEAPLTVEALRLYFDRLKDDGFLQILGRSSGATAQATMSTVAEAWKKSARADVDLHAIAVLSEGGKSLETIIIRMKPFTREERDRLILLLGIAKTESGLSSMLVSDSSGAVLTENRPMVRESDSLAKAEFNSSLMWISLLAMVALIVWVAMQERRKGVASRWQTASVATYFAGLGLSFAFFQVFFVLRAIRVWGVPSIAMGLAISAVFVSLATGATVFAGHPRRRYGVRIQPLANFVFAVMFTYLGGAFVEPLVASGAEWISAFVGMSILIPFGLLGGSFLPNALEEASEKLAPRVLSLLWALYAVGTALGIYIATIIGIESGLDVVFLAGLFCFAWVAIFSGLVRPWSVRKASVIE